MIEILAVVRRNQASATKQELTRIGCTGYSQWPVLGRGRQRGLQDAAGDAGLRFLPKVLFNIFVEEEQAGETIEAIIRANQAGQFGDGRIFVLEAGTSYRVSTDAQEPAASAAPAAESEPATSEG